MNPLFDHIFIDNRASKTLVLLHGTGGSKSDFLFLDTVLEHSVNLLALQGNILEDGMPRFFKRKALGIFDQQSIKEETQKLRVFIEDWAAQHDLSIKDYMYFGYSNGANMILATLFYFPELIHKAVLLHPMLPFEPAAVSLKDTELFVSHGLQDSMVTVEEQQTLTKLLKKKGATVVEKIYPYGHQLTKDELQDAITFVQNSFGDTSNLG